MAIFATVVEEGSFSAAARSLGVSKAAVSKQVALLEQDLGVQLLHRTTRRLSVTEIGEAYVERCARVVAIAADAERVVRQQQADPRGLLRVSAPVGPGQMMIASAVASFADKFEHVRVELLLDDAMVNIVEDRVDVAIRAGRLADSSLRARKIAELPMRVCAAPRYLRRHGTPKRPADLADHRWLGYTLMGDPQRLRFRRAGRAEVVRLRGRVATNDGAVLRRWLLDGLGLTMLPDFWVADHLADKTLRTVLGAYRIESGAIYAVHAHGAQPPPKVRLFIDHLVDQAT